MSIVAATLGSWALGKLLRARDRAADTIAEPRVEVRPLSIGGLFKVAIVLGLLVGGVAVWSRWDAAKDRDAWWRAEIKRSSQAARTVMEKAGPEIAATDADVLKAIGAIDAALAEAEDKVRNPPAQPAAPVAPDGPRCPRIKRECLH